MPMHNGIEYKKLKWKFRRKYKYEITREHRALLPKKYLNQLTLLSGWNIHRGHYYSTFFALLWVEAFNGFKIVIRKGYRWDGCSGPTIDTKSTMRAGLVHDCLYQAMREGGLREPAVEDADRIFHKILLQDGTGRFRAWYYFKGVNNRFAHRFAKKRVSLDNVEWPRK